MSGADVLAAASVLATTGSASYSNSINSRASSALARVSQRRSPPVRDVSGLSVAPAYSGIGTRSPAAYRPDLNGRVSRRTSAGVTTPFTPGNCAAIAPRTDAIRAWAYGLRRMHACSIRGRTRSSTKCPRRSRAAAPPCCVRCVLRVLSSVIAEAAVRPAARPPRSARTRCTCTDCSTGRPDLLFGWIGIAAKERMTCHHEARCAEAALQGEPVHERFLNGCSVPSCANPSIVVTSRSCACTASMRHDLMSAPSTSTEQARTRRRRSRVRPRQSKLLRGENARAACAARPHRHTTLR